MGAYTKWSLVVSDALRNAMVHFYSQVAMEISRAEGGLAGKIQKNSNSLAAQRPEKIDKKWRSGPKHAGTKERHQRGVMWGLLRLQRGENGQTGEGQHRRHPHPTASAPPPKPSEPAGHSPSIPNPFSKRRKHCAQRVCSKRAKSVRKRQSLGVKRISHMFDCHCDFRIRMGHTQGGVLNI